MNSFEIRQAINNGEDINELLIHHFIGKYVKDLGLKENQVLIFNRPIQELPRSNLYRVPAILTGIEQNGKYIFRSMFDARAGDAQFGMALIDLLAALEKGEYQIF